MPTRTVSLRLPKPYPGQVAARKNAQRNNVLCWGRRAGKTTFGTDLVIETVVEQGAPLGWFAPSYKILNPVWDYYVNLLSPLTAEKSETDHYIRLVTGGTFECWSMDAGIVARSRAYKRGIMDEAAFVKELISRLEKEIYPTLVDFTGDFYAMSTPDGENDFKTLFDRQYTSPETWAASRLPTWDNPYLPKAERDRAYKLAEIDHDPVARQEYGAEFISGHANFVPGSWVDACALYGDHYPVMPAGTPICVGLDAASKRDTFAISGVWKDYLTGSTVQLFCRVFEPAELRDEVTGIVTFAKPRQFVKDIARDYHVVCFAFDPFQLVDFAGQLYNEGIGLFLEFPQTTKRALADKHFEGLIREGQWGWNGADQEHKVLAQHVKNADAKIEAGDKTRMVKRTDDKKIDAAVATSMACYALTEFNL